jgi:hypothetical protein
MMFMRLPQHQHGWVAWSVAAGLVGVNYKFGWDAPVVADGGAHLSARAAERGSPCETALRRHIAAPSQDISGLLRSWRRTIDLRPIGR